MNIFLNTELTECLFLEFLSNCPQKSVDFMCSDNLEAYDDNDLMEAYVPVDEAPDDVDDSVENEYEAVLGRVMTVFPDRSVASN